MVGKSWLCSFVLVLPLQGLASGCGGGAEPTEDAGDTTAPSVDTGEPADTKAGDGEAEPAATAEGWGSVKGRIVYGGDPPEQPKVDVPANIEFCKDHEIVDETLIVHAENKGVKNVFVYLRRTSSIAPELTNPPADQAIIDQERCVFIPHAQVMRVEQGLKVISNDPTKHNTHTFPSPRNQVFNQIINENDRIGRDIPISRAENKPFQVKCDIHPWMSAWVLPLDHPYGVVTDENGNFEISNLPAGEVSLMIWHESKPDDPIDKGKKVAITAGETTDLGDLEVPAGDF